MTAAFSDEFSDEFDKPQPESEPEPATGLVTLAEDQWTLYTLAERPEHPPYNKLWRFYKYNPTPMGLLLWKTGEVKQVMSFYDNGMLTCDDNILGGRVWYAPADSWQAQVLTAAGYTLTPYEGPTTP